MVNRDVDTTISDSSSLSVRERFEANLPKYGTMWRAMAAKHDGVSKFHNNNNNKENNPNAINDENKKSKEKRPKSGKAGKSSPFSLLPAILNKEKVSLTVSNEDCNCEMDGCLGCAAPILVECDEDSGVETDADTEGKNATMSTEDDDEDDDATVAYSDEGEEGASFMDDEAEEEEEEEGASFVDDEAEEEGASFVDDESEEEGGVARFVDDEAEEEESDFVSEHEDDTSVDNESSEEEWVESPDCSDNDDDESSACSGQTQKERRKSFNVIIVSDNDVEESEEESEEEHVISIDGDDDDDNEEGESDVDLVSIDEDTETDEESTQSPPQTEQSKRRAISNKNSSSSNNQTISTAAFTKNRDYYTNTFFSEFNKIAFGGALDSVETTWSKRLNTTAGITRLKRITSSKERKASIEMSTKVVDTIEKLRSTLMHEMCHAAAWLVDGTHKPPHGKCFKKWAKISMKRVKDVEVTTTHNYVIAYKYAWACTNKKCDVIIKRHSRSVNPARHCCAKCHSKLYEIEIPGSKNDISSSSMSGPTPKKKREPTAFSLFVQTNSKIVRDKLKKKHGGGKVNQTEVMKECGRLWKMEKERLGGRTPAGKTKVTDLGGKQKKKQSTSTMPSLVENLERRLTNLSVADVIEID